MNPNLSDTSPEVMQRHYEIIRGVPLSTRLTLALHLTEAGRKLVLADLHHRFPNATELEIRERFISRILPRADVLEVYGFDPQKRGY